MKFLLTTCFLLCSHSLLFSQTISITSENSFNTNTYSAGNNTVTIQGSRFMLGDETVANPAAWSFSSSNQKAAFINRGNGINLMSYSTGGELLLEKNLEFFVPSDNTMNAYQFDPGSIALRDNVANFSFVTAKGEIGYSVSNSSGSMDGEQESQLASDPSGNTIVLYNPVISYGNQRGSRAQFVYGEQDTNVFFTSRNEEIKNVKVSEDGAFVTLLTSGNRVIIFDRFGNELFSFDSDENLIGATLDENATHLTIYSSGRVQVYEVPSGDRLGSASSRSSILFAGYDHESQTIIALGGNLRGRVIEEPEITAVSISQREIARQEVPFSISTLDLNRLNISKSGSGYEIEGLNRQVSVDVSF